MTGETLEVGHGLENQAGYLAGKPKGRIRFLVVMIFFGP
jgi:hypothetical protein